MRAAAPSSRFFIYGFDKTNNFYHCSPCPSSFTVAKGQLEKSSDSDVYMMRNDNTQSNIERYDLAFNYMTINRHNEYRKLH